VSGGSFPWLGWAGIGDLQPPSSLLAAAFGEAAAVLSDLQETIGEGTYDCGDDWVGIVGAGLLNCSLLFFVSGFREVADFGIPG
jgi:hypothetical protein